MAYLSDFCEHLNGSDLAAICDFVEYEHAFTVYSHGFNVVDRATSLTILQVEASPSTNGIGLFSSIGPDLWGTYESERYAHILKQIGILIRERNLKIDWDSPTLEAYFKPKDSAPC